MLSFTQIPGSGGYFACVNSGKGFVNYFDRLTENCRYFYAVKGGPGTGKSGLLKRIAAEAERRGETAMRIFCSSDPASLDGVILTQRRIAALDATAPHVYEVARPGIDGEYVNLGEFWNKKLLREQKERIVSLGKEKANAFARAYSALASAEKLRTSQLDLLRAAPKKSAFDKAVKRVASSSKKGKPKYAVRPVQALGMNGAFELDTVLRQAGSVITLPDDRGAALLFLSAARDSCAGEEILISPDPITLLPQSLFCKERALLVRVGVPLDLEREKVVFTGRFFDLSREEKQTLRSYEKALDSVCSIALSELSKVRRAHFALEELYKQAMDFSAVDDASQRLIRDIFTSSRY